jgi:REP element-mobilizing transposase RayT
MTGEARVFRLIHHAHAATTELSHDVIVGDCFADHSGGLKAVRGYVRPVAKLGQPYPGVIRTEGILLHRPPGVWQARFYDFNVWTTKKRIEKLRYMHRNPVKRALVEKPEQWRWSSYRFYLLDEAGPVRVNEAWTKISFRDRAA